MSERRADFMIFMTLLVIPVATILVAVALAAGTEILAVWYGSILFIFWFTCTFSCLIYSIGKRFFTWEMQKTLLGLDGKP